MTATALEILKHLPKKDCGRCGIETCFKYALKLSVERKTVDCPLLTEKQKKKLHNLIKPKITAVEIGPENNMVTVGGEEVLYRHQHRFINETKIFIEVSDEMPSTEIRKRIDFVKNFRIERIGQLMKVDGLALKCNSNNAKQFTELVKQTVSEYIGPIILSSNKPAIHASAAPILKNSRPLLFGVKARDYLQIKKTAEENNASFSIHSEDVDELIKTAKKIGNKGNLLFDCGTEIKKTTMLRRLAVSGVKEAGHPLITSTTSIWENNRDIIESSFNESLLACTLINRYISLLIMHTTEPWALLPVLTLRRSLYSDPQAEPTVESKLYEINSPTKDSPVLITSNFALTYYSVLGDVEKAKTPCFILPIDTSGLAVTVSIAADILTANKIKEALEKNKVAEKVNHRRIIIPGFAARLKKNIEETTNWEAIVGPNDSSQIPEFLKKMGR